MNNELISTPLNRVFIVDKNSLYANPADNWKVWMDMNLIITIDYANNTFSIVKNRWGDAGDYINLPIPLLPTFLFHPELTDEESLMKEKV
jgi:hypothetical protein